jgi:hypothetical protein
MLEFMFLILLTKFINTTQKIRTILPSSSLISKVILLETVLLTGNSILLLLSLRWHIGMASMTLSFMMPSKLTSVTLAILTLTTTFLTPATVLCILSIK